MTFEQWLSEWLAQKLNTKIYTVITPKSVSVELRDTTDTGNKWQREGVFGIYCKFESKEQAAHMSQDIQNLMDLLNQENYINKATIETEQAERTGAPLFWVYSVGVRIKHRRRPSW